MIIQYCTEPASSAPLPKKNETVMSKPMFVIFLNVCCAAILHGQSFQHIRGAVRDKLSGEPLEYATVTVQGLFPPVGNTTDGAGQFLIPHVPVGRYDIRVGFVGYEPVIVKDVLLSAAKETFLEVWMTEHTGTLGEVVVRPEINKSQPLNSMALGSARMLSVEEAGRYAGGFDDPARLASAFAGVASGIANNGIAVRGNSPKFLQWRLEGVEIPNPNHFAEINTFGGGALTAFSSHLLGNSDFFTGAFPAEYGNALSGVFDMQLRTGNSHRREHTFRLGAIGIDFASEGPFRRNGRASYIFNYRYSTLALLSAVLPENAGGVRYQDISFKLNVPTSGAGVFSIWGIGLLDRSGQKANADSLQWVYMSDRDELTQKQYTAAAGINHKAGLGRNAYLHTSLAATAGGLSFRTDRQDENLLLRPQNLIENTNIHLIFSSVFNRKFSAVHTHKAGIRITGLLYDMLLKDTYGQLPIRTVAGESGGSALLSAFTASSFHPSDAWTLNMGLHAQYFALNGRYTLEPRAGLRRKFNARHSAGLSYGLHSRLEMLHYYFIRSASGERINKNLDFTRAHHLVATYDWAMDGRYHLRIEPYVQQLFRVPVAAGSSFSFINLQRDWFVSEKLENTGMGLNCGVDITFERYMAQGYYYIPEFDVRTRDFGRPPHGFDSHLSSGLFHLISYVELTFLGRSWRSNQCFHVGNGLESEGNDAKTQGRVFANYFSSVFSTRFLLCCSLKKEFIRTY
jgi:hypothetical protein